MVDTGLDAIAARFRRVAPAVAFWSLRLVDERREGLAVRQDVLQPVALRHNLGAMATVYDRGGIGYAATSDVGPSGLARAAAEATEWAHRTAAIGLVSPDGLPRPSHQGEYQSLGERPWAGLPLGDKIALLHDASAQLKRHDRIVDWRAELSYRRSQTLLATSAGGLVVQTFGILAAGLAAVANRDAETQRRTHGYDLVRVGGLEQLDAIGFPAAAPRVAEEALALLDAPDCPSGRRDLLLMPSQMILQIHESIGHPLELDRILGDERNYAGTSFVTLDMFGSYRYGSDLLNVTFDPTRPEQLASYGYDDEGTPARREYIIRKGILERPLGSATSQARAGLPGVANGRASDWNRPPMDRMANLNLEPGDGSLEALIGSVRRGVLMDTNRSWSIDDSRNKFQFGCEVGRLIEDGRLKGLVKNPNYRGISAGFWRSLSGVGDASTFRVMAEATCGKGEPNQMIRVGHASPACVFRDVDVFGGAA